MSSNVLAQGPSANQNSLEKITTGDLADGVLTAEQFQQFFREVQDQTVALDMVRTVPVTAPTGEIPKVGVGERLLQAIPEGTRGTLQTATTGVVNYDTTKVGLPYELTTESVRETIEGEQTANTLMELFAQQFAVDTEDLAFNGDTTAAAGSFTAINDGWIKIATDRGAPEYQHGTVDSTNGTVTPNPVDNSLFHNMITTLGQKYKRADDLVFMGSLSQKEAYKEFLTDRSTGAGDAMLMTDQQPSPYGYNFITPPSFPDDQMLLTSPDNLLYIIQRDMNVRMTQEGEEWLMRDLYALYNMIAKLDFQIEDENAMVRGHGIAAP